MRNSERTGVPPSCAASQLEKLVDTRINGSARQEFADATSALQEAGADLGEGSAYLDESEITFTPQSVACGLCKGVAVLSRLGAIDAEGCRISGMCEFEWAKRYPHEYISADGTTAGQLICGAEIDCSALVGLQEHSADAPLPIIRSGVCELAERGDNWKLRAASAITSAGLTAPEAGIAAFDGQGSGREE
jgi:hypothetical protein